MNKDEILMKVKNENEGDEMERQAVAEGSKLALNVGIAVCLILVAVKIMTENLWQDVLALVGIMSCVPHFYCWKKLNKRQELLNGFIWLGFGLIFTVLYMIGIIYY